jgi:hypothetical protein
MEGTYCEEDRGDEKVVVVRVVLKVLMGGLFGVDGRVREGPRRETGFGDDENSEVVRLVVAGGSPTDGAEWSDNNSNNSSNNLTNTVIFLVNVKKT